MLLEIDVEIEKIQVLPNQIIHPDAKIFGAYTCSCCHHTLHGHGWRLRYYIDADNRDLQIWIHRMRCPCCGMTFTLVPKWVHVFKCYSVQVIKKTIELVGSSGFSMDKGLIYHNRRGLKSCNS